MFNAIIDSFWLVWFKLKNVFFLFNFPNLCVKSNFKVKYNLYFFFFSHSSNIVLRGSKFIFKSTNSCLSLAPGLWENWYSVFEMHKVTCQRVWKLMKKSTILFRRSRTKTQNSVEEIRSQFWWVRLWGKFWL